MTLLTHASIIFSPLKAAVRNLVCWVSPESGEKKQVFKKDELPDTGDTSRSKMCAIYENMVDLVYKCKVQNIHYTL